MKIVILASVGCKNLGDELILKNTIKHFENRFKNNNPVFHIFSYDTDNSFVEGANIRYHEYFPCGSKGISRVWKNMKNYDNFVKTIRSSDLVIIGGGGLFFDSEDTVSALKNLNLWIFRRMIVSKYKKQLFFYGIGINFHDIQNTIYKKKIQSIFENASEIYVRDTFSQAYLEEIQIESQLIHDPVFEDAGIYKEKKKLKTGSVAAKHFSIDSYRQQDFEGKKVGIAIRKLHTHHFEKHVVELIEYLIQKKAKRIILLAHSFHPHDPDSNDYEYFKDILEKYFDKHPSEDKKSKIYLPKSIEEVYNYYTKQKPDIIFASRLHSIILSKVYKIPYFVISYSRKTDEHL